MPAHVICEICGNEVESHNEVCPYCDHSLPKGNSTVAKKVVVVRECVIKEGNPTVDEALTRFDESLRAARGQGIQILRIIHGYGSSGEGGAIKDALRARCRKLVEGNHIRRFVTGEEYFNMGSKHNPLIRKYPELMDTWRHDRGNKGVTIVEI